MLWAPRAPRIARAPGRAHSTTRSRPRRRRPPRSLRLRTTSRTRSDAGRSATRVGPSAKQHAEIESVRRQAEQRRARVERGPSFVEPALARLKGAKVAEELAFRAPVAETARDRDRGLVLRARIVERADASSTMPRLHSTKASSRAWPISRATASAPLQRGARFVGIAAAADSSRPRLQSALPSQLPVAQLARDRQTRFVVRAACAEPPGSRAACRGCRGCRPPSAGRRRAAPARAPARSRRAPASYCPSVLVERAEAVQRRRIRAVGRRARAARAQAASGACAPRPCAPRWHVARRGAAAGDLRTARSPARAARLSAVSSASRGLRGMPPHASSAAPSRARRARAARRQGRHRADRPRGQLDRRPRTARAAQRGPGTVERAGAAIGVAAPPRARRQAAIRLSSSTPRRRRSPAARPGRRTRRRGAPLPRRSARGAAAAEAARRAQVLGRIFLHADQQVEAVVAEPARTKRLVDQRLHSIDAASGGSSAADRSSTASAASSVKPPSNTDNCASAAFSGAPAGPTTSRTWRAASPGGRCAAAARRQQLEALVSSAPAACAAASRATRAAASSIASGRPSSSSTSGSIAARRRRRAARSRCAAACARARTAPPPRRGPAARAPAPARRRWPSTSRVVTMKRASRRAIEPAAERSPRRAARPARSCRGSPGSGRGRRSHAPSWTTGSARPSGTSRPCATAMTMPSRLRACDRSQNQTPPGIVAEPGPAEARRQPRLADAADAEHRDQPRAAVEAARQAAQRRARPTKASRSAGRLWRISRAGSQRSPAADDAVGLVGVGRRR